MKKLILYAIGGLSNRIFPLVSCMQYAKDTNRDLYVYCPLDRVFPININELYNENLNIIDEDFLNSLDDTKTKYHCQFVGSIINDNNVYGRHFIFNKYKDGKVDLNLNLNEEYENLVLLTNTFLNFIPEEQNKKILRELKLYDTHRDMIKNYTEHLKLNKNVLGGHLRGTDFYHGVDYYVGHIKELLTENKQVFICSDDEELELSIYNLFPEQIIYRKNKKYVTKYNSEQTLWGGWGNNTCMNDIYTMVDAICDLYLLSKTDLKFCTNNSAYSMYAKILSEE